MEVPLTASTVPRWPSSVTNVPSAFLTTLSPCRCCGRWALSGLLCPWAFSGLPDPCALSEFPGADDDGGDGGGGSAAQAMATPVPVSASATAPASAALRSFNGSRTDIPIPPTATAGPVFRKAAPWSFSVGGRAPPHTSTPRHVESEYYLNQDR